MSSGAETLNGMLDEVRIYNGALSQEEIHLAMLGKGLPLAYGPTPADGAMHWDTWVSLSWFPGTTATSHDVYFGDDEDAVENADTSTPDIYRGRQGSTSYTPPEGVEWGGGPYYWRVDEVNDLHPNSPWKGNVWSFRTFDGSRTIAAPASTENLLPGAENLFLQLFHERQGVILPAPVAVDDGIIPAGAVVDSHMIFLNTPGLTRVTDTWTWVFEQPILGVMSDVNGMLEAASNSILGAPGTKYPGEFFSRGFNSQEDWYTVTGNSITVSMLVTEPGDWIRVVTRSDIGIFWDAQLKACVEAHLDVTDPTPTDMLALTELACAGSNIFDLTGLEYAVNLMHLDLSDNRITDISALQALTLLKSLNLLGNPLNVDAFTIYLPLIQANNPGVELYYDPLIAWAPNPPDGAKHVVSAVLSWRAGQTAAFHDVYLGSHPGLTGRNFIGRLTETKYSPPLPLVPGITYYWRVDEVEADDVTVHTGQVWSFTLAVGSPIEQPEMGSSLGEIDFDNPQEFAEQIQENNFQVPENPEYDRIHVEQVEDLEPDPTGMMRMQNLEDLNPASPTYDEMVHARAKGAFEECDAERILVRFSYLFEQSAPGLEIVAYLSDVPGLLDLDDPEEFVEHYIEIGRVPVPPATRPGSVGSGRFGIFEQWVSVGSLDLSNGTWIELELVESQPQSSSSFYSHRSIRLALAQDSGGGSALIDDPAVEIHCSGICMDLNWSDAPDEEDFLLVLASCGESAGLLEGGVGSRACLDGPFSTDGYVDSSDIASWDWALSDEDRSYRLNLCKVPIAEGISTMSLASVGLEGSVRLMGLPNPLSDLLIAGKRDTSEDPFALKSKDRLYAFDREYQNQGWFDSEFDRCSIRLVKGPEGELYQINSVTGIVRLDSVDEVIVPPGQTTYTNEPRYNESATVYIGIQNESFNLFGRPILDAAFDVDYVYVVPVVVNPHGEEAYLAAAKLQLLDGQNPPYRVVRLYDEPPLPTDNQYRNNLREIEIDGAGNIYVINAHSLNESDILWKYDSNGAVLNRLDLGNPDSNSYLPDPVAMHVSDVANMVYLASGQKNEDPYSKTIYCFSKDQMVLENSIAINGMQHVTGITEDPATGTLWVVGFNMIDEIPMYPNPTQAPFYYPCLAKVSSGGNSVEVTDLLGSSDLGLPMSIVWTASAFKPFDGFETGDFNTFDWKSFGDAEWVISTEAQSGSYCAQAGSISDDDTSTLSVTLDCVDGDITFYRKVSSEQHYDYLRFYIDGLLQDEWSGNEDWTKVSFPVRVGRRTFEWTYSKDGSSSNGSDTAWIDDIEFPCN